MPTYPATPAAATVSWLLKQPQVLSRDLVQLTYKKFVADRLFVQGTPEQVAGGALRYQRDEDIFLDRDPEQIAGRGYWPRTGWSEDIRTEAVKEFGLETVINYLSIRRNARNQLTIAQRKLANNIVRFVDTQAMAVLEGDADVNTQVSAAVWTLAGTDVIAEIGKAQETIENQDNGYDGFAGAVLVAHTNLRDALLNNTALRSALPRETTDGQIRTGMIAPFLGLREIIFTPRITSTVALVMDSTTAGVIADERPDPEEGFVAYDPGDGKPPIWVQVYDEKGSRDKIVSGGRWPAMALTAPKAVVKITGVA